MKRVYITTLVAALLVLAVFAACFSGKDTTSARDVLKVGFIYDNDESTPYTYNFTLARRALEKALPGRVRIYAHSNVSESDMMEPIQELVRADCDIIFTNSYSKLCVEAARMYPQVQFCQTSFFDGEHEDCPENYHTFNGAIYQGRYVTGVAAGLKLRDMIDTHVIGADEALVGYVGAFPSVEVVSGFTAFLLGVRSVAPEAVMHVRYTGSWNSYNREKAAAEALIEEGCLVIAQHTDTIGPAMACESASARQRVFHVGYNQNMIDIPPATSLISTRVVWTPYVVGAAKAVLEGRSIEKSVAGSVHGNDISGGLDLGWVEVMELNKQIAVYGTQEKLNKVIESLNNGSLEVFKGNYTGVSLKDPSDTIDLNQGYRENDKCSWATFHYLLEDVIIVDE